MRISSSAGASTRGNLTEDALNASAKSWSRFQEFLHVNNIDEVMEDVQSEEGGTDTSADGAEVLAAPLLSAEGKSVAE